MDHLDTVQVVNLVGFVLVLAVALYWMLKEKTHRRWYMLGVFSWAIHGIVFYAMVFACVSGKDCGLPMTFSVWSQSLRLHGILTILSSTVAMLFVQGKMR